jgi:putative alpha-1,2-mannosidase
MSPVLESPRKTVMKKGWVVSLLALAVLCLISGCPEDTDKVDEGLFCPGSEDLAALVDPMIGTQGSGNAVPGALLPHGMVKLSPDTNVEPGSVDAYEYNSDKIEGFSHTHLQGPGGGNNGYSHILLMPTSGDLHVSVEEYASTFSHQNEEASPGYYAVTLDDYGIRAELTATAHSGLHRYTYPQSERARVIIDLGHSRGDSRDGNVEVVDDRTIQGYGGYNVHPLLDLVLSREDYVTGGSTVYFHARFSKPFSSYGTWKGRAP